MWQNDRPGPGSYEGDEFKLKDDRVYSKKGDPLLLRPLGRPYRRGGPCHVRLLCAGLGVGFVSKAKRSGTFTSKSEVPGPGNYEQRDTLVNEMKEVTAIMRRRMGGVARDKGGPPAISS